jgi:hypothetical protein
MPDNLPPLPPNWALNWGSPPSGTCKCPIVTGGPMVVPDCPIHAGPFGREVVKLRAEVAKLTRERDSLARRCAVRFEDAEKLRADVEALLPPATLYLAALDADPDNELLTLPEAILVTAVRDAVARHTDPATQDGGPADDWHEGAAPCVCHDPKDQP